MALSGTARKAIGAALLLGGGSAIILWEPWHGPTILSLSSGHGIDAGDLPALLLIALAVALARSIAHEALGEPRWLAHSWPGATCAIVVGALLLLAGLDANAGGGPLVSAAGGTFNGATQHASARRPNPVHQWAYIASTYDGAALRLFINGSPVSSRATTGTLLHTTHPLWIGGNRPYGEYFQGLIDEVRVYDRALSAAEVREEMLRPAARASRAGLVAAYAFEEGAGAVAADASGKGNVGAVSGTTRASEGRFGRALRFDGTGDVVRIAASTSLDLRNAMTLAAWIRPSEAQDGWRTILHRQTDAYFLAAGSDHDVRLGPLDDARAALLVGAGIWFSVLLAHGGDRWVGRRRRSWGVPVALFLAGSVADAALAPSLTLIGPALLATWMARTASHRGEAVRMYSLAALFVGVTVVSVAWQGFLHVAIEDGDVRSAALGLVLLAAGVPALATAYRVGGGRGRPG